MNKFQIKIIDFQPSMRSQTNHKFAYNNNFKQIEFSKKKKKKKKQKWIK